jgi:hypothetical protein
MDEQTKAYIKTEPSQCPRCLKHLGIRYDDDGIHTCTPTPEWWEMEQDNDQLREALSVAVDALSDFDYDKRMAAIAKCREVL